MKNDGAQTAMSLFPYNSDPSIVRQSEIEYRVAKHPFRVRHRYIAKETGKDLHWDSTHCPVCFWKVDLWDSLIDKGTNFCRRCGQKILWEEEGDNQE